LFVFLRVWFFTRTERCCKNSKKQREPRYLMKNQVLIYI
jgi:hypothetical protein